MTDNIKDFNNLSDAEIKDHIESQAADSYLASGEQYDLQYIDCGL